MVACEPWHDSHDILTVRRFRVNPVNSCLTSVLELEDLTLESDETQHLNQCTYQGVEEGLLMPCRHEEGRAKSLLKSRQIRYLLVKSLLFNYIPDFI